MQTPLTQTALTKVLVVDDDPALRRLLADYLNRNGYDTLLAEDTRDLRARIRRYRPHMMIMDRMLPDGDGVEACRRLREAGETIPIIMLSGRDETSDKIFGLQAGADDYLGKPFSPHELLARMEAILRRQPQPLVRQHLVQFGPFSFDLNARQLSRAGESIRLTSGETNLLEALVKNPSKPLSRDHLLALVHDNGQERTSRAVDIAILRLRRVIEENPKRPRWIQTIWGLGYCFVPGTVPEPAQDAGGQAGAVSAAHAANSDASEEGSADPAEHPVENTDKRQNKPQNKQQA